MKSFSPSREHFLYFRKRKHQKNFLDFFKWKLFLYFRKRKPRKNALYFRKGNFGIFHETAYISGSNFPSTKSKKNPFCKNFLYCKKYNFLDPSLKRLKKPTFLWKYQSLLKQKTKGEEFYKVYAKTFLLESVFKALSVL